jgi:hypothetical protein
MDVFNAGVGNDTIITTASVSVLPKMTYDLPAFGLPLGLA